MKRTPVIIRIDQLAGRIDRDGDNYDISDALGVNELEPPEIEDFEDDCAVDNAWDAHDRRIREWIDAHADQVAVVTWPEHVLSSRYNSDANYNGPMTLEAARAGWPDAVIYGE